MEKLKNIMLSIDQSNNNFPCDYTNPNNDILTKNGHQRNISLRNNVDKKSRKQILPSLSNKLIINSLTDWDEKNLKTQSPFCGTQVDNKINSYLMYKPEVSNFNLKRKRSKQFLYVRLKNTGKESLQYMKEIEDDRAVVNEKILNAKNQFRFDVFNKNLRSRNQLRVFSEDSKTDNLLSNLNHLSPINNITNHNPKSIRFSLTKGLTNELCAAKPKDVINIDERHPMNLPGSTENLVKIEVIDDANRNKCDLEKKFNQELSKTTQKIEKNTEKYNELFNKREDLIADLNNKQIQYLITKEAMEAVLRDEKFNKKQKTFVQSTLILNKVATTHNEIQKLKENYEEQILLNQKAIPALKIQMRELKEDINSQSKLRSIILRELIKYYLFLLKTGTDVRNSGLSWIIIKLLELGVKIDHHLFPSYVGYSDYLYLMSYSNKKIELNSLSNLANDIKKHHVKKKKAQLHMSDSDSSFKTKPRVKKNASKGRLEELIDQFYQFINEKNYQIFPLDEEIDCDKQIKRAVSDIKLANNNFHPIFSEPNKKKGQNSPSENNILVTEPKAFDNILGKSNVEKKNVLDALVYLNKLITNLEGELNKMKSEHISIVKNKYKCNKNRGTEACIKYNMLFTGLFGKYIKS